MTPAPATNSKLAPLKILFDSLPNMIALVDASLRFRLINQAYSEFFNITEQQLMGQYAGEVLGPAYARMLDKYFAQALKGKSTTWVINHSSAAIGEKLLSVKLLPYPPNKKNVRHILFIAEDITETVQLHQKLSTLKEVTERHIIKSRDELDSTLRSIEYHALKLDGSAENDETFQTTVKRRVISNRVQNQLEQMQHDGGYQSYLVFTISNYASIVQRYGEATGKVVLRHFADRLDTLLGDAVQIDRLDRERVAIAIPDLSLETAQAFGQLLCEEMKNTEIRCNNRNVRYGVYAGATSIRPNDASISDISEPGSLAYSRFKQLELG